MSAEVEYSHFALNSLLAENAGQVLRLEELLVEFAGFNDVVTELDLLAFLERAQVAEKPSEVADLLCELGFLGMEVEQDRFEYLYNDDNKAKLSAMARRGAEQNPGGIQRYRINRPFHSYLEIKTVPAADSTPYPLVSENGAI